MRRPRHGFRVGVPVVQSRLLLWRGHRFDGFDDIVELGDADAVVAGELASEAGLAGAGGATDERRAVDVGPWESRPSS